MVSLHSYSYLHAALNFYFNVLHDLFAQLPVTKWCKVKSHVLDDATTRRIHMLRLHGLFCNLTDQCQQIDSAIFRKK